MVRITWISVIFTACVLAAVNVLPADGSEEFKSVLPAATQPASAPGVVRSTISPATTSSPSSQPASQPAGNHAGVWLTSYEQAAAQAKASNKLILADFTGSDWCIWCKRLKAEVFDTAEFKTWATANIVLLELDYPRGKAQDAATRRQNVGLAKKYNIEGYPTILFLDANGATVGRLGYMPGGPKPWIVQANAIVKRQQAK